MINDSRLHTKFTSDNISEFLEILNQIDPVDLAELIAKKSQEEQLLIFNSLPSKKAASAFEYLPFTTQKEILKFLFPPQIANLLNAIAPDDRTALLQELPRELVNQLLKYLSPEERAVSLKLLGYREDSVGRLMTPDYIAIKMDWTVQQVLDYVREKGKDSETINVIYAIDDKGVLIDDFRIKQFLFASLSTKVDQLADNKFIALNVNDDEEQAINYFRKYSRLALPVIDFKGILLGIVTIDDIMHISIEKDTEDFHKIGGLEFLKEPYLRAPLFQLIRKRGGWLVILFVGELLTASAMGFFQQEIAQAVVLALFLPLVISSGGNAGSQASTLIIRALALKEISLRDWWKIMRREIFSGFFLGCLLGLIGFFRISLWSIFSNVYGAHWFLLAITIFFTLIGVVLWGTLSGSMLPLLLKRCGFDPAVSSAPFVATLVDVTGIIIYFSTAFLLLHGTLL